MPNSYLKKIARENLRASTYRTVRGIIEHARFKTITFESIQWLVDNAIEYNVQRKINGGIKGGIQYASSIVLEPLAFVTQPLSSEAQNSIREIQKAARKSLENAQLPPEVKNINPLAYYSNLANGADYKKGSAGDFSHYDPSQPKDPSKPNEPSELSNNIFGRTGRDLSAGVQYNQQVQQLHSSENFALVKYSNKEEVQFMLQTQLTNFNNRLLSKIQTAVQELSSYMLVSYSRKNKGSARTRKFFGWAINLIEGYTYYLSDQDEHARKEYVQNLTMQECNHYLKRIDKNLYQNQVENHLYRYNLGEDKGIMPKKERYTIELGDFNKQARSKLKISPFLEEEQLLEYINNPHLLTQKIQEAQAKTQPLKNNPFEVGIYNALSQIDKLITNNTSLTDLEMIEKIKKEVLIHTQTYGELAAFRYFTFTLTQALGTFDTMDIFIYCFKEFPQNAWGLNIDRYPERILGSTELKDFDNTAIAKGKEILQNYNTANPQWDNLGAVQAFTNLYNASNDVFFDKLLEVKDKVKLYRAQAEVEDYNNLLKYTQERKK